jgi:hypothetical protein
MSNPLTSEQESLQVQKRTLTQSKIANVQLAALNLTNLDIAASNRRIETIQRNTLNETKRQTAVLELQLEETKLAKLEKTRQQQLKQAAFSLNKEIEVLRTYRIFPRLILAKKLNSDVATVGLTATELHEISDKEYADTVLNKLQEFTISTEKEMSESDKAMVMDFQTSLDDLESLTRQVNTKQNEAVRAKKIIDEKKQILANNSKRKKYKYPVIIFFVTIGLAIKVSFMLAASDSTLDDSSFGGIVLILFILFSLALILCPIWVISNLVYNSKIQNCLNSRQIQQANGEIKTLEDKIKDLANQEMDLRNKLKTRQQMHSDAIIDYPELKNLAFAI